MIGRFASVRLVRYHGLFGPGDELSGTQMMAVQVSPSNGPSECQESDREQSRPSRRADVVSAERAQSPPLAHFAAKRSRRAASGAEPDAESLRAVRRSPGAANPPLPLAAGEVYCTSYHADTASRAARALPEETPVAFTYARATHAVMLATPADLEDFAIGFSLTEGIIHRPDEVEDLDIVPAKEGVELRIWLAPERMDQLPVRQRRLGDRRATRGRWPPQRRGQARGRAGLRQCQCR